MLIRRKPKAKKRRKVRKKKSKGSFADELEPIEDGTSAYPAMAPTRRSLSRTVPGDRFHVLYRPGDRFHVLYPPVCAE